MDSLLACGRFSRGGFSVSKLTAYGRNLVALVADDLTIESPSYMEATMRVISMDGFSWDGWRSARRREWYGRKQVVKFLFSLIYQLISGNTLNDVKRVGPGRSPQMFRMKNLWLQRRFLPHSMLANRGKYACNPWVKRASNVLRRTFPELQAARCYKCLQKENRQGLADGPSTLKMIVVGMLVVGYIYPAAVVVDRTLRCGTSLCAVEKIRTSLLGTH